MRRATVPALVIAVGLLLLADLLVVNPALAIAARVAVDAVILVAAGAAVAAGASLAVRRAGDLWRRRGDPIGAVCVLVGIGSVLVAGLRPGADGPTDPAVGWIVAALILPIGASVFGLLFMTTLASARRSVRRGGREAVLMVVVAVAVLVMLLPVGGSLPPFGPALSGAADWVLSVPIAAVLRGILLGAAITAAVLAARTLLGIGTSDE